MDRNVKPEKCNPQQRANFLSQWIFAWTVPLLYRGSQQGLKANDLTQCLKEDHSEELGDRLQDEWHKELENCDRKSRKPLLRNALFRCFLWPTIGNGLMCFIVIVMRTLIPAVLAQLLLQFESSSGIPQGTSSASVEVNSTHEEPQQAAEVSIINTVSNYLWTDIYGLATLLVVSNLVCCLLRHHLDLRQSLVGARMRIACCSLIYRKTLRLSMKTAGQTSAGYVINLLSNDVNRLDYGFFYMHWIWILPIQAVLTCYLIWRRIGAAALVGVIGLLLKTVPLQSALSKLTSVLRLKIAERTDIRVGIMSELVQGIQVIKMYAWEKPFQAIVAEARRCEVKQILYASYLRGFYMSTRVFTDRSTLYITLVAAALMGQPITADFVFSAVSYYNILQLVAANWYPLAVTFGAEALVSLRRVQTYLQLEDRQEKHIQRLIHQQQQDGDGSAAIVLKEVSASWNLEASQCTLQKLNLSIGRGELCAIIGPVGAGKSSLLQLLLGELPIIEGGVVLQGEVSYCSQEPWLFHGTVRSNILFGEHFEANRYQEIIDCCTLNADFQQLRHGDQSIVGERGASLSGGQQARISLARAIYKPASVYLLDDPLSAVDAHVGRHLFDAVIGPNGHLAQQKATRVLVTHQVHFLAKADWIVIVEQGRILRQGTYQDLINSELDFAKLLERPKESALESQNMPGNTETAGDYYVANKEEDHEGDYQPLRRQSDLKHLSNVTEVVVKNAEEFPEAPEHTGGAPGHVWYEYFRAGSTFLSFSFMVCIMLLSQIVCSGADYFSNYWTQQDSLRSQGETTRYSTLECIYLYGALIVAVLVMTTYRGFVFFKISMHASKELHNRMFSCVLHATMRFFDTNPSGRILNRFSKDIGAIDELLPRAMMDLIQNALVMFGIFVVISVVNPVLIAAMIVVAIVIVFILKLYLRPSQDLKRLEGNCRSPVFTHLSSSLLGLSVIRSRRMEQQLVKDFDNLQDVHSSAWRLMMTANTALGLWMDCVTCIFLAAVTFSFIIASESTFIGNVGLAISQALGLTGMIQFGVRQLTESLQQMTSVERVLQYTELEQEEEQQPSGLDQHWPPLGQIELRDLSCRYDPQAAAILKHLSLTIQPGWKVGVVGRTGAGKSSLIAALFRLAHIEGGIYIDGIDTASIPLKTLRTRISIIPQNPVLFSASIRYNLDPFERYSDAELWQSLEQVELRSVIPGLDFMVTERGSNFSVGQRQLLCLARAILRNNRILVLDEATANVDPQTDSLIQRTIRCKFRHCTVITVAHRLHTVMDSDRIIVMDVGHVAEFDIPHLLLQKPHGLLRQMIEATGGESDALKQLASDSYKRMQEEQRQQQPQLAKMS